MAKHVCPWWLAYTFDNPLRTIFHQPERMLGPYVRPGMTAADIGCGMGFFALGIARLVGPTGQVLAVDIQEKMLEKAEKRAGKAGLSDIIRTVRCQEDDIAIAVPVDFALAFWMVHETPDEAKFLKQLHAILKPGGLFLMAEPKLHVTAAQFEQETDLALLTGFRFKHRPKIALSHAALLEK